MRALFAGALVMIPVAGHFLLQPGFRLQGGVLWVLTHASFLPVLCIRARSVRDEELYRRMSRLVAAVLIVQALVGLFQAAYGFSENGTFDIDNGDYVEGTISPAPGASRSFSNVMFASNVAFMLLFLLPGFIRTGRHQLAIVMGAVVLILASVVHNILFLAASVGIAYVLFRPAIAGWRLKSAVAVAVVALPIFAGALLATNLSLVAQFYVQFRFGTSPRGEMVRRVAMEMPGPYPAMPWVGLGPGQFSSRAGMISTGRYFGGFDTPRALPVLGAAFSQPQDEFLRDLWREAATNPSLGSTHVPYFSWLSAYTEFGVIGVGAVLLFALSVFLALAARKSRRTDRFAFSTAAAVLFLCLLGFQENYWEVPQAILIGLLQLKVTFALATFPRAERVAS